MAKQDLATPPEAEPATDLSRSVKQGLDVVSDTLSRFVAAAQVAHSCTMSAKSVRKRPVIARTAARSGKGPTPPR